jgi:hypothetical protein
MKIKYLQFPLCLIQEVLKDRKNGLNKCVDFGIFRFAKSQKVNLEKVARQLSYEYHRRAKKLPDGLYNVINEAKEEGRFTHEDDSGIFIFDNVFDPELNVTELEIMFEENNDFKEQAILHYQIHQATEDTNITLGSNAMERYEQAARIQANYEAKFGPDAMPSVKPSLLCQFRDDPKQDIDILLAYIGISSLIGQRNFISTSKPVIISRMIGAKSKASNQAFSKTKESQAIVTKYSKRWNMDKLLLSLAEQKFIMYITRPHVSVVYVSKYMEPEELAELIRQSREKHSLKNKIKAASEKI